MRCRLGNNTYALSSVTLAVLNFIFFFDINSPKFNLIFWKLQYLVMWNAAIQTSAFFLRKRLKDWYTLYKVLLLSWQILVPCFVAIALNLAEIGGISGSSLSLKGVGLHKAVSYNCILRYGTTQSMCFY